MYGGAVTGVLNSEEIIWTHFHLHLNPMKSNIYAKKAAKWGDSSALKQQGQQCLRLVTHRGDAKEGNILSKRSQVSHCPGKELEIWEGTS